MPTQRRILIGASFGLLHLLACNPIADKAPAGEDSAAPPVVDTDWPDSGTTGDTAPADSGSTVDTDPVDSGPVDSGTAEDPHPCDPCLAADPTFVPYADDDCDGDGLANSAEAGTTFTHSDGSTHVRDLCDGDTDDDTLLDSAESAADCEDPTNGDSDGDGLSDGEERGLGTSSCSTDTDGDGLSDLDDGEPIDSYLTEDNDGDGLTLLEERGLGTSDTDTDSDDDGLRDNAEVGSSDPTLYDTDGDCFPDGAESNARNYHMDHGATFEIDLEVQDSDGDGLWDGIEEYTDLLDDTLLDPACNQDPIGTLASEPYSDLDSLTDGEEVNPTTSPYASDPNLEDTDADGLDDDGERTWNTDPTDVDTDDDCFEDGPETTMAALPATTPVVGDFWPLNPVDDADSDDDGLMDGAEVDSSCPTYGGYISNPRHDYSDEDGVSDGNEVMGLGATCTYGCVSDPMVADTDGDTLDDEAERTYDTDPLSADTDGDLYSDADEVSWGALKTASVTHYGADKSLPDALDGVNEVLTCSSVSEVKSDTFLDPYLADSNPYLSASVHYTEYGGAKFYSSRVREAWECHCTVDFNDVRPQAVTGISVWIDTDAHTAPIAPTASEWTTNQTPSAVAVYLPWLDTTSATGFVYTVDTENVQVALGSDENWHAFGYNPVSADVFTYSTVNSGGANVPVGRVNGKTDEALTTIVVSRANTLGEDIGQCGHLAATAGSAYPLNIRLDSITTATAIRAICPADGDGSSTFRWIKMAGPGRLMPVAGEPVPSSATPTHIRVTDWREAHSLRGRDLRGRELRLSRSLSTLSLPAGQFLLEGATWEAAGAAGEPVSTPLSLDINFRCTGPTPAQPPSPLTLLVSWALLEEWTERALDLPLSALVDIGLPMETAAFQLRIAADPVRGGEVMILEASGVGELDRIPVTRNGQGRWDFDLRRPKLELQGGIVALESGAYELRIVRGAVGAPGERHRLRSFQSTVRPSPAAAD